MSLAALSIRDGLAIGAVGMALLGSQVFEANLTEQTRSKAPLLNSIDTHVSISMIAALVLASVVASLLMRGLLMRGLPTKAEAGSKWVSTPRAALTLVTAIGVPIGLQAILSALEVDMAPAEFNALGFVTATTSMGVGAWVLHTALNT